MPLSFSAEATSDSGWARIPFGWSASVFYLYPVIKIKGALEGFDAGILDAELNTHSSIQNVKKFAASQGLFFEEKKRGINHESQANRLLRHSA